MAEQIKSLKTGIKYKDTPIGKIPVDWEVVRLCEICDVIGGSTPSTTRKEFWSGDIPFATPTDITNLSGREISNTKQKITQKGLSSCGTRLLPAGSILLTSRATIGACAINAKPMATNQGFASLVCNEKAYNWYIFYEMMLRKSELQRLGSGSTFKEVSKNSLKQLNITLPPLAEQRKIAEILSTVDETIEKTDQIIEKTKEAKKGLMQRLLTSGIGHEDFKKTILGKIPIEWNLGKLGDMCIGQPEYGANVSAIDKDASLPRYVRITDITEGGKLLNDTWQSIQNEHARPYILTFGDILFARSGATVGKTYLYNLEDGKCAFAGYLIRFKPNPEILLPEYLFHYTHSDHYYNWVKGMFRAGAQPNINAVEYSGMLIPTPPISEQKMIVRILDNLNKNIDKELNFKEHLNSLKTGLMQVLLTGRIRVKT